MKHRYKPYALYEVFAVYSAGFVQGLTMVSFPASSTILREMHGLNDAQYGAIFLPQVCLAIIGAVLGGVLASRLGLSRLLWIALVANALSQLMLALTASVTLNLAFPLLLVGTGFLGLGFGLSGAPLNSYPPQLFPARSNTAVVAMHSLLGLGLMAGPLLLSGFLMRNYWLGFPIFLHVLCVALAFAVWLLPLSKRQAHGTDIHRPKVAHARPLRAASFWVFFTIAVLYAFAEGTFSNWAVIYLQEDRQVPATAANTALSAFWGALVAGRLITSALVLWIPATAIWMTLPALMIVTFLLLPSVVGAITGIALFAMAGFACSSFFPLSIAIVSNRFPEHVAWVSSMMIAALMAGVGIGTFAVGALRMAMPFETLYLWSTAYPIVALLLGITLVRTGNMGAQTREPQY